MRILSIELQEPKKAIAEELTFAALLLLLFTGLLAVLRMSGILATHSSLLDTLFSSLPAFPSLLLLVKSEILVVERAEVELQAFRRTLRTGSLRTVVPVDFSVLRVVDSPDPSLVFELNAAAEGRTVDAVPVLGSVQLGVAGRAFEREEVVEDEVEVAITVMSAMVHG